MTGSPDRYSGHAVFGVISVSIKKTEQVRCFDPAHNLQADAWKMDYRLYYDVVLKNSLAKGIYTYTF